MANVPQDEPVAKDNIAHIIKIPTGKTNKSGNAGSCTNLAKVKAEVVGITDRLIIVRLPNGILDSITIKEYAIERMKR